jgi:hypothetical protein
MATNNTLSYSFPSWLVNTLIASILAAMFGITGYMLRWNISDVEWKATIAERLLSLNGAVDKIEEKVDLYAAQGLDQKVNNIDRRLEKIEETYWAEKKRDSK